MLFDWLGIEGGAHNLPTFDLLLSADYLGDISMLKKVAFGGSLLLFSVSSFAVTTIDYATAVTSATAEATGAINAAVVLGAIIIGASVGWRMLHKFVK